MKKNDVYTAVCSGYTEDGSGVVRIDNIVFFVAGLMTGETAEIGITKLKKNYGYGRVIKILDPSPDRVPPRCSVHRLCGGCTLQYMNRAGQDYFKEEKVRQCFRQIAHIENPSVLPILKAEGHDWNYRNKVQIPVRFDQGKIITGFYQNHTNRIIPYDDCPVQTDLSNRITAVFRKELERFGRENEIRHLLIKHARFADEVMVAFITRCYPFKGSERIIEKLRTRFPQIVSISAIINRRDDNVILDGRQVLICGRPYIEEKLLGRRFRISAKSFYQINPYATEILYEEVLKSAGLTGEETVVDMYCGTGTIGILAAARAKKVYGIEIVEEAVRDAFKNAAANNVQNIRFLCMDAARGAALIRNSRIKVDVVIVDPPRKGCSKETIDAIIKINPEKVVYVSCDPATLARDVAIFNKKDYLPKIIQPLDMFPQTPHVETVVLMSRAGA